MEMVIREARIRRDVRAAETAMQNGSNEERSPIRDESSLSETDSTFHSASGNNEIDEMLETHSVENCNVLSSDRSSFDKSCDIQVAANAESKDTELRDRESVISDRKFGSSFSGTSCSDVSCLGEKTEVKKKKKRKRKTKTEIRNSCSEVADENYDEQNLPNKLQPSEIMPREDSTNRERLNRQDDSEVAFKKEYAPTKSLIMNNKKMEQDTSAQVSSELPVVKMPTLEMMEQNTMVSVQQYARTIDKDNDCNKMINAMAQELEFDVKSSTPTCEWLSQDWTTKKPHVHLCDTDIGSIPDRFSTLNPSTLPASTTTESSEILSGGQVFQRPFDDIYLLQKSIPGKSEKNKDMSVTVENFDKWLTGALENFMSGSLKPVNEFKSHIQSGTEDNSISKGLKRILPKEKESNPIANTIPPNIALSSKNDGIAHNTFSPKGAIEKNSKIEINEDKKKNPMNDVGVLKQTDLMKINNSERKEPVNEKSMESEVLRGPFLAKVVKSFPKSSVATFSLSGVSNRAYFFHSNVIGVIIPQVGTDILLEELVHVAKSQLTKTYEANLQAHKVTISQVLRKSFDGRTGKIVKYTNSNSGLLEIILPNKEHILGTFSKNNVQGVDLAGKTLESLWGPGEIVHFCGELITTCDKKEFIVKKVWPQGKVSKCIPYIENSTAKKNKKKNTDPQKTDKDVIKTEAQIVLAHTGQVSGYRSQIMGLIDFRIGDLYLTTEFKVSHCEGLLPGKSLTEQWPIATMVHFDGELLKSQDSATFNVSRIWSKKQNVSIPIIPELNALGPHVGEVIELRPPGAFIVSVNMSGKKAKVFVISSYFRLSLEGPKLKKIVSLEGIVYVGQHVGVFIKHSAYSNKNDCEYVATDAWPENVIIPESIPILKCEPSTQNLSLQKQQIQKLSPSGAQLVTKIGNLANHKKIPNREVKFPNPPCDRKILTSDSYFGNCVQSIRTASSIQNISHSEGNRNIQHTSNPKGAAEGRVMTASTAGGAVGASGGAALPRAPGDGHGAGPSLHACVVQAYGGAALLRVMTIGRAVDSPLVAALARDMFLCGVPLVGVDLTHVLAPGQELDVHLLAEEEKRLTNFGGTSTLTATPSMNNCVYVSVLWLGRAIFESSSMQFAELTSFCQLHKVPDAVRHKLALRLGQMLEVDGPKKIKRSFSEDDLEGGNFSSEENTQKVETNGCKQTSRGTVDETQVLFQLEESGPKEFLRMQLQLLTHSVLKESLRAAEEFFLSSLKEHCGSSPLYDELVAETPVIMEAAVQEFFVNRQKERQSETFMDVSSEPAQDASASGACAESVLTGKAACEDSSVAAGETVGTSAISAARDSPKETLAILQELVTNATSVAVAASSSDSGKAPAAKVEEVVCPSVSCPVTAEVARQTIETVEEDAEWTEVVDDGEADWELRKAAAAPEAACRLLRGVERALRHAKEKLEAIVEEHCAMQQPEKQSKVDDKLTKEDDTAAVPETSAEAQKFPMVETSQRGEPDTCDYQKTLDAEIQKHARELALFRDEACHLIENWKSADSPPATPEELEFLQELSFLLDNKVEGSVKSGKKDDDTFGVAQQLIKFWNAANFPLTPVAQRGLQRLQELFDIPEGKMEGSKKETLGSSGDGLVEVEAALKEVRDAFRDVKHVFEVQRCFRDLRECFRDVRRAYRGREPRPRALPPCADAPAAAAAAALAEAVVQVKKRGRNVPGVTGSRTPSPTQTSPQAQPKKKSQFQCPSCKAGLPCGVPGEDSLESAVNNSTSVKLADKIKIEVLSKSSQTTASVETGGASLPTTVEQSAQTISTGAVLALHLLPDQ